MTSLAAWVGVDSRGISSLYFASDSRITWDRSRTAWNFGKKLFASKTTGDVFGYCGDVLFPVIFLGQLQSLLDSSILFDGTETPLQRHKLVAKMVEDSLDTYSNEERSDLVILHGARGGRSLKSEFHIWNLSWSKTTGWTDTEIVLPNESRLALALGSGADELKKWGTIWQRPLGGVSRAVFGAFCDALRSGTDPKTGGAPQLVRLYRDGPGLAVGIIYKGHRFLQGISIENGLAADSVEWRNALFERCDGKTLTILKNAQRQPLPW
jgi:hypothetical protein